MKRALQQFVRLGILSKEHGEFQGNKNMTPYYVRSLYTEVRYVYYIPFLSIDPPKHYTVDLYAYIYIVPLCKCRSCSESSYI